MKVCHISTVHSSNDIRIMKKECRTLSRFFDVTYAVGNIDPSQQETAVKIQPIKKRSNRASRMFLSFFDTMAALKKVDADIYHLHDPELVLAGYVLKKKGKKVIYDAHEDIPRAILSKYWIRPAFRKLLCTVTEKVENYFASRFDLVVGATPYITERFSHVNRNVVNINNFPLRNELAQSSGTTPFHLRAKQVCYVGGIGRFRGLYEILKASDLTGDCRVAMAGPISDGDAENLPGYQNVDYKGILDRTKVKELLNESLAGIVTFHPEPNHINAQPNKMFEYMSAGLPVICSDFPMWREIIEKHKCGICVDPLKPEELAEAIHYLAAHPDVAEQMGKNGRKAVEREYNWEMESEKLVGAYQDLLSINLAKEVSM